jgi:hypothetical protein
MNKLISFLGCLVLLTSSFANAQASKGTSVYELRVYTSQPGKLPHMLARFKHHTCKLFERHGMVNVGYWLPLKQETAEQKADDQKDGDKLYYLLKHKSRAAADASWAAFNADPEWIKVRNASEEKGAIVQSVESTFLAAADYSPEKLSLAGKNHVFELRIYTTNDGKLATLDTRFREHTMALFTKQGMTNLAYWHPTDADKGANNTLVYILAHKDRASATKSWADFIADPEWISVRNASEENGKILIDKGVKSVFLTATDFSALK